MHVHVHVGACLTCNVVLIILGGTFLFIDLLHCCSFLLYGKSWLLLVMSDNCKLFVSGSAGSYV